jgi:hypothetical protein
MADKPKIVVRGNNALQPPLLVTEDARTIEFYDGFGDLNALMFRVLSDEMWGLVTKDDPDWQATLIRFGYLDVGLPMKDIIKNGLG